jgi:hypothetical protein
MDYYGSTDLLISDFDAAVSAAVDQLGFDRPRPQHGNWSVTDGPGSPAQLGFSFVFLRANRSLAIAPTRLELFAAHGLEGPGPPYRTDEIFAAQGTRPIKTHALTIATSQMDELLARAKERGWRHRVDPPPPAPRLWIGFSDDEPSVYRPDIDGGLMIEFFPTTMSGYSFEEILAGADASPEVPEGGLVRIVARAVLVDDLDTTLACLASSFGWEPDRPTDVVADEGCRRAVLAFRAPHSARLELLHATGEGQAASFHAQHGSGPWQITVSVQSLDAKLEAIASQGIAHELLLASEGRPVETLRVRPNKALEGAVIDFVDHRAWVESGDGA